jgi:ribosomal protein L7/L12
MASYPQLKISGASMTTDALTVSTIGLALAAFVLGPKLHLAWLRHQGIYPKAGSATHQDVTRLVALGRKTAAVRCFRELHGGSLKQAKAAVTAIAQEAQLVAR